MVDVEVREATLKEDPLIPARDLAEAGAYIDNWHYEKPITCHKCNMIFMVDEIENKSKQDKISFKSSAVLLHKRRYHWCPFIQDLPTDNDEQNLGKNKIGTRRPI